MLDFEERQAREEEQIAERLAIEAQQEEEDRRRTEKEQERQAEGLVRM